MANTPEYTRKAVDKYRNKFDVMQLRLPKGTRDRIAKQSDKIHDFVVDCVLSELERLEELTEREETYRIEPKEEQIKKTMSEEPKHDYKPITDEENAIYMKLVAEKRAEQKEREEMIEKAKQEIKEQGKAKEREEINKIIDKIINRKALEEDFEKEMVRNETISQKKYSCD